MDHGPGVMKYPTAADRKVNMPGFVTPEVHYPSAFQFRINLDNFNAG